MSARVGFGPRLAALAIDGLIVNVLGLLAGGLIGYFAAPLPAAGSGGEGDTFVVVLGVIGGAVAGVFVTVVLYGVIEAVTGASPGKMVLGIQAGFEDGRRASTRAYVTRWAVKYAGVVIWAAGSAFGHGPLTLLGALVCAVTFLGCLLVLGDRRQAFHDMAATTAVFRRGDLR